MIATLALACHVVRLFTPCEGTSCSLAGLPLLCRLPVLLCQSSCDTMTYESPFGLPDFQFIDLSYGGRTLQMRPSQLTTANIAWAFRLIADTIILVSEWDTVALSSNVPYLPTSLRNACCNHCPYYNCPHINRWTHVNTE